MSSRVNGRQTPPRVNYAGKRANINKGSFKAYGKQVGIFNEDKIQKQAVAEGKRLGNMYADNKAASEAAKKAAEEYRKSVAELAEASSVKAADVTAAAEPVQSKSSLWERFSNWFNKPFKGAKEKREIKKAYDAVIQKEAAEANRVADAYQAATNAGFEKNLANISAKESAAAYKAHGLTNMEKALNEAEGVKSGNRFSNWLKNIFTSNSGKQEIKSAAESAKIFEKHGLTEVEKAIEAANPKSAAESAQVFIEHGLTSTEKKLNFMDKVSGFFKGKGGKALLIGLGVAALATAAYFVVKGINKKEAEKAEKEEQNNNPVVDNNEQRNQVTPNDSTVVQPSDSTVTPVIPPVTPNDSIVVPDPSKPVEPSQDNTPEPSNNASLGVTYTVQKGDKGTWGIAQKLLTKKNGGVKPSNAEVTKLSKLIRKINNLHLEPDNYTVIIQPNQKLILPDEFANAA